MHFFAATLVRGQSRRVQHDGREFLVVPALATRSGVYVSVEEDDQGNVRPISHYLPEETIRGAVSRWAGMPVSLGHPRRSDRFVSARRPDVWESEVYGLVHNPRIDGDRLRVDVYIDLEKAARMGEGAMQTVQAVEAGEVLEVSVGFGGPARSQSGTVGGQRFESVLTDMYPDHLAILLPGEEGQCSVADGCGLGRVAQKIRSERTGGKSVDERMKRVAVRAAQISVWVHAEVSHDEIGRLLEGAMSEATGDMMNFAITHVFDDFLVYHPALPRQMGEFQGFDRSRWFRRNYSVDENQQVTLGDEEEVVREESFRPVQAGVNAQRTSVADVAKQFAQSVLGYFRRSGEGGNEDMNRDTTITALAKVQDFPFDEKALKGFSDTQLAHLASSAGCSCGEGKPAQAGEQGQTQVAASQTQVAAEGQGQTQPAAQTQVVAQQTASPLDGTLLETVKALGTQITTLAKSLENIDERIGSAIDARVQADQKAQIVAQIRQHADVPEDDLKGLSVEALERMQKAVVPANYIGRPFPRPQESEQEQTRYDKSGVVLKRVGGAEEADAGKKAS